MNTARIALVQTTLAWEDAVANREHFEAKLDTIDGADLIVLPEMFSTGFSMASEALAEPMDGPTVAWMQAQAASRDTCLCGSLIIEDGGHYYNRFLAVMPDGAITRYDKRHLFRLAGEHEHYSPGERRPTIALGPLRVFPQVCYDLRFPAFSRNNVGYDLLVYVANWPAARREHWRTLLRARAIENQCFVAGLNRVGRDGNDIDYSGDSVVFDFAGETLLDLGSHDAVGYAELDRDALAAYRETFPFWRDADAFELT
jgi:predicted amidohydrolase